MGRFRNIRKRIQALEAQAAERHQPRRPVPTETLAAFTRGYIRDEFAFDDIDQTNCDQMTRLHEFYVTMIVLGPTHQAWCDVTPWGRAGHDQWMQSEFGDLDPDDIEHLRQLAASLYPAEPLVDVAPLPDPDPTR